MRIKIAAAFGLLDMVVLITMTNVETVMPDKLLLGLISEAELASMLDVKASTLQQWRSDLVGPDFVRLGKAVFYRKMDVDTWIAGKVQITNRQG